jgi:hypothetical protein
MATTLKKGGCSLGTQRVTTKRTNQRANEHRTDRRENETLHFDEEEARSQISDTQANRWQEHLDRVYGTVGNQRNRWDAKRSSTAQTTEEMTIKLSIVSNTRLDTGHIRYAYRTRPEIPDLLSDTSGMLDSTKRLGEKSKIIANGIQKSWNVNHSL